MSLNGTASSGYKITGKLTGFAETIRGYSAYEVAVINGFKGTEEAWLASLKGEKGDKGETGDFENLTDEQKESLRGEKGEKGDKGDKGDIGDTGADYVLTDADKQEIAELAADLVPGGGTVELDTTLKVSGKAADAKAVGDNISKITNDVANVRTRAYTAEGKAKEALDVANEALEVANSVTLAGILPSTADDAGKFVRVLADGTIGLETVAVAEGVIF